MQDINKIIAPTLNEYKRRTIATLSQQMLQQATAHAENGDHCAAFIAQECVIDLCEANYHLYEGDTLAKLKTMVQQVKDSQELRKQFVLLQITNNENNA